MQELTGQVDNADQEQGAIDINVDEQIVENTCTSCNGLNHEMQYYADKHEKEEDQEQSNTSAPLQNIDDIANK